MKMDRIWREAAVAAALAVTATCADAQEAKYVFLCIGDGMGVAQVTAADLYARRVLGATEPLLMMQMPVASMAVTRSASSDITDSAAAGTALSTGHKTRNGMLGMDADTATVYSVADALHEAGYGIGLVTSVAIDDATPAAFYAHVPNRGLYREIGGWLAKSNVSFAAGAGLRGLRDKQGRSLGLIDELTENGMQVTYGPDSIDVTASRVLLLGPDTDNPNSVGYTIDSAASALTLQQMTQAGMEWMQRTSPQKFFMMIEGGNIDHAGHGNDAATNMVETVNFDRTLSLVYDFYKAHPDETLIVVTADHETGGLSLTDPPGEKTPRIDRLAGQRMSKEAFSNYCKGLLRSRRDISWEEMRQYMEDNLGLWRTIPVSAEQAKGLEDKFEDTFEGRNEKDRETLYASFNAFSEAVFGLVNAQAGTSWATDYHSGCMVPVFAVGAGSQYFNALLDNTDIPARIALAAGLPSLSEYKK